MADKKLTHFIVDLGSHMSKQPITSSNAQFATDLDYGLQFPLSLVTTKILRKRKTDYVSLLTVDDVMNESNTGLEAVSLIFSFKQPFYCELKEFNLTPVDAQKDPNGDGIVRSLLYSIDIMDQFVKKKKIKREVVIVTNSHKTPELDDSDFVNAIVDNILKFDIDLTLIGVDFDNQGANQENIKLWKGLFRALPISSKILNGDEAFKLTLHPAIKPVRPTAVFKGQFRIGADLTAEQFDSRNDLSCLCFDVEAYKAVMVSKPEITLKKYGKVGEEIFAITASSDYTIRHYKNSEKEPDSDDEDEEDLEYETELIDKSKIKKSYKYGKNSLTLPPELQSLTVLKQNLPPGLDLRGVVHSQHMPKAYLTGESLYLVPSKDSDRDIYSMYALVDSLNEMQSYGVARYVAKPGADVSMMLLIPCLVSREGILKRKSVGASNEDVRCLMMVRLPYFEDVKLPVLPSLLNITDSRGESMKSQKLKTTEDVHSLMDDLVSSWDITTPEDKRSLKNSKIYAHVNHEVEERGRYQAMQNYRVNQVIRDIAVKSLSYDSLKDYATNTSIPELPSIIKDQITVTNTEALSKIDKLSELLNVKKVERTEASRRGKRRNFNQEFEVEEKFDEWSLEELLARADY